MSIHESAVRRACASAVVVLGVAAVAFSTAGGAETRVVGVAGSDSNTVLTRQVADLQMRVNKLERTLIDVQRTLKKPDTPDDDGGSDKPDKKGAGGGKDANASGSNTTTSCPGHTSSRGWALWVPLSYLLPSAFRPPYRRSRNRVPPIPDHRGASPADS